MSGWTLRRLDEVATVIDPNPTHRNPRYVTSGFPFVSTAEFVEPDGVRLDTRRRVPVAVVEEQEARCHFSNRSVLFSRKGTIGKTRRLPADTRMALLDSLCVVNAGPDVDPAFLTIALRSPAVREQIELATRGVALKQVSVGRVRSLLVPVPTLGEQCHIVAKLDALRARSRRAKDALDAVPGLLDRFRQSILSAAFRGDLTADWRTQNPDVEPIATTLRRVSVPPSRTGRAATINEIEGDAALAVGMSEREPPPGWKWVPLTSVATLESGHTPSRSRPEWWGGEVDWIAIPDARDHHGRVIARTETNTNAQGLANSAARILPARTVCLSRTASVGYVTIMGRPMATSQDFANWVCSAAVLPEWLMYLFLAEGDALIRFAHGAVHSTIYFPELKAFHVCLPPVAEQQALIARVEEQLRALERLRTVDESARTSLAALDPSVLTAAFRGELLGSH